MPYTQTLATFINDAITMVNTRARNIVNNDAKVAHIQGAMSDIDLLEKLLPSGSGIDCGTRVVVHESKPGRLVLKAEFHHMNEHGYYAGWTSHKIVVTPCFSGLGIEVRVTGGRNRNDVNTYLHDVYYWALAERVEMYLEDGERKFRFPKKADVA